jgi:hypothetical protein
METGAVSHMSKLMVNKRGKQIILVESSPFQEIMKKWSAFS